MSENKSREVVISTSGVNCYGGRVLTSGGDLTQYMRNPVLYYNHERYNRPIGTVENIRIDGDRIIGTPNFDRIGELSKEIADKWEAGTLKMASAGLDIVEQSDAKELLQPGQTRMTVTKWKLVEVSIVDIGGNDDAIRLYNNGKLLELGVGCDNVLLPLNLNQTEQKTINHQKTEQKMETVLLKLGLPKTATEAEVLQAVEALQSQNVSLKKEKEDIQLRNIGELVDRYIADGKVTADKKEHFVNLGKVAGYDSLNITLSAIPAPVKPNQVIAPTNPGTATLSKKWDELSEAERIELRKNDWDNYVKVFTANYGFAPLSE